MEKTKVNLCKSCGKNDSETKFYEYLNTRCILCKRKSVKDSKNIKEKSIREEKIENIDPDEKIRYLWSEMMREPFYRNGRKSILDFMEETEQDISDLLMSNEKLKSEFFTGLDKVKEEVNILFKFRKEFESIIDLKISLAINKMKEEIIEEIKNNLNK
jgi:hypothetical protein